MILMELKIFTPEEHQDIKRLIKESKECVNKLNALLYATEAKMKILEEGIEDFKNK